MITMSKLCITMSLKVNDISEIVNSCCTKYNVPLGSFYCGYKSTVNPANGCCGAITIFESYVQRNQRLLNRTRICI